MSDQQSSQAVPSAAPTLSNSAGGLEPQHEPDTDTVAARVDEISPSPSDSTPHEVGRETLEGISSDQDTQFQGLIKLMQAKEQELSKAADESHTDQIDSLNEFSNLIMNDEIEERARELLNESYKELKVERDSERRDAQRLPKPFDEPGRVKWFASRIEGQIKLDSLAP